MNSVYGDFSLMPASKGDDYVEISGAISLENTFGYLNAE